jgi:hypothetical protein
MKVTHYKTENEIKYFTVEFLDEKIDFEIGKEDYEAGEIALTTMESSKFFSSHPEFTHELLNYLTDKGYLKNQEDNYTHKFIEELETLPRNERRRKLREYEKKTGRRFTSLIKVEKII